MKKEFQMQVIVNMMKYFSQNTQYCHLLKMMKLMYLADLYSLRDNGDIISGIQFKKWEKGPVAEDIYHLLKDNKLWKDYGVKLIERKFDPAIDEDPRLGFDFKFKDDKFNDEWFSENELRTLKKVTTIYKDVKSKQISDITHRKTTTEGYPWSNADDNQNIDFEDYLGEELTEEQKKMFKDIFEFNQKLREYERSKT